MRKLALLFAVLTVVFLAGCSNGSISGVTGPKVKINQIEWNVSESIVDGERTAVFNITNNSRYDLAGFLVQYKEKEGIADEEKSNFINDFIGVSRLTDEGEIANVKTEPIMITAYCERYIPKSGSENNNRCFYYDSLYYMNDFSKFNLVEPDMAIIKYIDDGKTHLIYYDFKNDQYSEDEKTEDANFWTAGPLADVLPKPEGAGYITNVNYEDKEDEFWFKAYGMTYENYQKYVETCKGLGFTNEKYDGTIYYSADNGNGLSLSIKYNEESKSMTVDLDKED